MWFTNPGGWEIGSLLSPVKLLSPFKTDYYDSRLPLMLWREPSLSPFYSFIASSAS